MQRPLVCVVEDDASLRQALCQALALLDADIRAFAGAGALLQDREALGRVACLVLKVGLRGIGGLDLQDSLRSLGVSAAVVFLSGPCNVTVAVRALRGGALDFMLLPVDVGALRKRVAEGIAQAARADARRSRLQTVSELLARLTAREREVLDGVVRGDSNAEVARSLGISTKTVEQHRARVMTKMRVASLAALVARVTEWRVLSGTD